MALTMARQCAAAGQGKRLSLRVPAARRHVTVTYAQRPAKDAGESPTPAAGPALAAIALAASSLLVASPTSAADFQVALSSYQQASSPVAEVAATPLDAINDLTRRAPSGEEVVRAITDRVPTADDVSGDRIKAGAERVKNKLPSATDVKNSVPTAGDVKEGAYRLRKENPTLLVGLGAAAVGVLSLGLAAGTSGASSNFGGAPRTPGGASGDEKRPRKLDGPLGYKSLKNEGNKYLKREEGKRGQRSRLYAGRDGPSL